MLELGFFCCMLLVELFVLECVFEMLGMVLCVLMDCSWLEELLEEMCC